MLVKLSEHGLDIFFYVVNFCYLIPFKAVFRDAMTTDVVPELISKLTDKDEDVRAEAARALPLFGKQG